MSYWDTSALGKLYAKEPDSAVFENHLRTPAHTIVSARFSYDLNPVGNTL